MKRQQLDKMIGKKISGGIGKGPRGRNAGGKSAQDAARDAEGKQPMAVRLIKGLGKK